MVTSIRDSLFLKAARSEIVPRPPVWFMRQAGRYMKAYRDIRDKHSFFTMVKTPELACEITLQPIRALGVDAAILFSDILVTPEAMGMPLDFVEGKGPVFADPIRTSKSIDALNTWACVERLAYVCDAIKLVQTELKSMNVPLIGFAGAPFTVASYMIEGQGSKTFSETRKLLYRDPELMKTLLDKITQVTIVYLNAQIQAGVNAIQIFDSWADLLSWQNFQEFSLPYIQKILNALKKQSDIPVIVFCKGSSQFAPLIAEVNPQVISLDWNCDMVQMRGLIPDHIALQGNLDPGILFASRAVIKQEVESLVYALQTQPGFILNLGHGLLPNVPEDAVKYIVDVVKELKV